jgi:hypothetical protein
VDARRATKARAVVLVQYFEQAWQPSIEVLLRRVAGGAASRLVALLVAPCQQG